MLECAVELFRDVVLTNAVLEGEIELVTLSQVFETRIVTLDIPTITVDVELKKGGKLLSGQIAQSKL